MGHEPVRARVGAPLAAALALFACGHADTHVGDTVIDTDLADSDVADTDVADTDVADTDVVDTDVVDTNVEPPPTDWTDGAPSPLPAFTGLRALPGAAAGPPVFTSNNPEAFTSTGFVYEAARADPDRGGASWPLAGDFGVYLHHDNDSGAGKWLQLVVTNPTTADLVVSGSGSAYTNRERPLARGAGPDFAVAGDVLAGTPRSTIAATTVQPQKAAAVWQAELAPNAYVDGRFALHTSAGAYVYLVVTDTSDVNEAVALSHTAATGNIHPPGDPPPPYGREAGVYANDTWAAAWTVDVPRAGHYVGYAVNTATGTGFPQIQAFPALTSFADSSHEAVGMYGNLYDLAITLAPRSDAASTVDLVLAAHGGGSPSFWWNGPVEVDDAQTAVWLAPDAPTATLATVSLGATPHTTHLRLFVPGLSSIPLGLYLVAR